MASMSNSPWRLTLRPKEMKYFTVDESFNISEAFIDVNSINISAKDNNVCPVKVLIYDEIVLLCNLSNQVLNWNLNLKFFAGSEVTFFTTGNATIQLSGYTVPDEIEHPLTLLNNRTKLFRKNGEKSHPVHVIRSKEEMLSAILNKYQGTQIKLNFTALGTTNEDNENNKSLKEIQTTENNELVSQTLESQKKSSPMDDVIVKELKPGNGPVANSGKIVIIYFVRYKYGSNSVIEKLDRGPGLTLTLGSGDCLKCVDTALIGKKVGSICKIISPPAKTIDNANKHSPYFSENEILEMDVELKSVY